MSPYSTISCSDRLFSFAEAEGPEAGGGPEDLTGPRWAFRIPEGQPTDYQKNLSGVRLCSNLLRRTIDSRCGPTDLIRWEDATVYGPEGEARSYFVLQFTHLVDAFDPHETLRGPTGSLIRPVIDPVRSAGHHIIPHNLYGVRFIVSEELRVDIEDAGCTGIHFDSVRLSGVARRGPVSPLAARASPPPLQHSLTGTDPDADRATISRWWSAHVSSVPLDVIGLWFGIAEMYTADGLTSMLYIAGTPSFDPTDPSGDWASDTCWEPLGTELLVPHTIGRGSNYRAQLDELRSVLDSIELAQSAPPQIKGAAVGFDDGDFEIILNRE